MLPLKYAVRRAEGRTQRLSNNQHRPEYSRHVLGMEPRAPLVALVISCFHVPYPNTTVPLDRIRAVFLVQTNVLLASRSPCLQRK